MAALGFSCASQVLHGVGPRFTPLRFSSKSSSVCNYTQKTKALNGAVSLRRTNIFGPIRRGYPKTSIIGLPHVANPVSDTGFDYGDVEMGSDSSGSSDNPRPDNDPDPDPCSDSSDSNKKRKKPIFAEIHLNLTLPNKEDSFSEQVITAFLFLVLFTLMVALAIIAEISKAFTEIIKILMNLAEYLSGEIKKLFKRHKGE